MKAPERDSRFREHFPRIGIAFLRGVAAGCLALAASGLAAAAPADDYQAGLKAYRGGDVVAATAVLRRAAEAGHGPAQVLLASILDQAEYNEEALAWYRKAAMQGDPEGEFGVGSMYFTGEGVGKDLAQAYAWFLRAAEKKHRMATLALASMYVRVEKGESIEGLDMARSAQWLRAAADLDHLPALDELVRAYQLGGYGLSPDPVRAAEYSAKADAIRKKMLPEKGRKKK